MAISVASKQHWLGFDDLLWQRNTQLKSPVLAEYVYFCICCISAGYRFYWFIENYIHLQAALLFIAFQKL